MTQARIEALVRQFDPLFESLVGGASEDRASIWGQSEQEANANPAAEEVKGSTHLGIGLIQWTGPRHTQLIQFAQSLGKPWQDTEAQVRFIGQELNGPYKHAWQQITTVATTLRSKTETAMGLYEGPAGWQDEIKHYGSTTAGMPRRLQGAQWALSAIQQLKGKPMTDTSNVPASGSQTEQQLTTLEHEGKAVLNQELVHRYPPAAPIIIAVESFIDPYLPQVNKFLGVKIDSNTAAHAAFGALVFGLGFIVKRFLPQPKA